ncbi:MAG: AtpZ/AtpI family protein [Pseudomonadota bacterium]
MTDETPSNRVRSTGPQTPGGSDDPALDARLEKLRSQLGSGTLEKSQTVAKQEQSAESKKSMAQAFRLSSEFIAGIVVGAGIGYLIDAFFGTSPWGLIVFLLFGFCAAVVNVLRAAGMMQRGSYATISNASINHGSESKSD